MPTETQIIVKE